MLSTKGMLKYILQYPQFLIAPCFTPFHAAKRTTFCTKRASKTFKTHRVLRDDSFARPGPPEGPPGRPALPFIASWLFKKAELCAKFLHQEYALRFARRVP